MKSWRIFLVLVGLLVVFGSGMQGGMAQGNSEAAHACQKGGWEQLKGTDGTLFADQDACVSYAAQGGMLITRTLPSITVSVAPAVVRASGDPGFTISGTGTNFTPNVWVHFQVQFHGVGTTWSHTFTADSQGGVNFNFTPFVARCPNQGFDLTAYDSATKQSVTTTVTTVPCD
ncbi:MAG: hypothetical protein H0T72_07605 [Chloroflexia bacterium]|nr:hypothetical protein [Chloroflexia bacterium]